MNALKQAIAPIVRLFSGDPKNDTEEAGDVIFAEQAKKIAGCEGAVAKAKEIADEHTSERERCEKFVTEVEAAHAAAVAAFDRDDSDANAVAVVSSREKIPRAHARLAKATDDEYQSFRQWDIAAKALIAAKAEAELAAKRWACSTEQFHVAAAPHAAKMLAAIAEAMRCAREIDALQKKSNEIAIEIGEAPLDAEHAVLDALRLLVDQGHALPEARWREIRDAMTPGATARAAAVIARYDYGGFGTAFPVTPSLGASSVEFGIARGGLCGVVATILGSVATEEETAQAHVDLDLMLSKRRGGAVEDRNARDREEKRLAREAEEKRANDERNERRHQEWLLQQQRLNSEAQTARNLGWRRHHADGHVDEFASDPIADADTETP